MRTQKNEKIRIFFKTQILNYQCFYINISCLNSEQQLETSKSGILTLIESRQPKNSDSCLFKCVSMGRHNLDSKLLRNTIISPWKYFLTKLRLEDDVIMLQRAATQAPLELLLLKKFFSWFQTCLLRSRAPSKRGQGPF